MMKVFDSARDSQQIKAGTHFYCSGHLTAVLINEKSPDPRYCQGCYDFLLNEVEVLRLNGNKRAYQWMPVSAVINSKGYGMRLESVTNDEIVPRQVSPIVTDNLCVICGSPVIGKRSDRKYCSSRCRQVACRKKELVEVG